MRRLLGFALTATILASWLVPGLSPAFAAIVPEVRDDAGFFSADGVARANDVIKQINRDFKKDLLIETFKTVPADHADQFKKVENDKGGRRQFFHSWAVDRAKTAQVNGVYILICKEPTYLEIEVGNETSRKAFTLANRSDLSARMLDKFGKAHKAETDQARTQLNDAALLDTVQFVYRTMRENLGATKVGSSVPAASTRPAAASPAQEISWTSVLGLLCIGLIVLNIIGVIIGLIRSFTAGAGGYPGGGWGSGGGFLTSLLGGIFGAAAGMWLYDHFFRGTSWGSEPSAPGGDAGAGGMEPRDTDYSGSGGDYGGSDAGGDFGGGGGGDFGGGDFGGGDF